MKHLEVVGAVIQYDGKILCMQRGAGKYDYVSYKYEFPGGKVEAGESPRQALIREIREELATDITVGEQIGTIEYDYPAFHLSMDCFWCEVVRGDLVLKEAEDARWLTREELASVHWLPADLTIIPEIEKAMSASSSPEC